MDKNLQNGQEFDQLYEKKLEIIKRFGLTKKELVGFYQNIYTSRKVDDAEITMKKQSKAFFQISGAAMRAFKLQLLAF